MRTDHVAPIRASVRDAVETILALLPSTGAVRFRDLTLGVHEKLEVIVRFLAVLELFKQGVIDLEQSESFADLIVLPLAPGERVELDLMSIADLDGEPIDLYRADRCTDDRVRGTRVSTGTAVDVEARAAIEAVVLAATEPVPPAVLAQLVELPTARVEELCDELAAEYAREGRGFQLARVAGGYRFQTHPDAHAYVERFVLEGQTARLSGPALETLAIVAYKQPIARAQISAIRGVNVDATLKTLVARGYIEESGHEHSPGNPTLFSTTRVPRTPRARLARAAAVAGRLRSRGGSGRGTRAGSARCRRRRRARQPGRVHRDVVPDSPTRHGAHDEGRALAEAARARRLRVAPCVRAVDIAGRVVVDGQVAILGARADPAPRTSRSTVCP